MTETPSDTDLPPHPGAPRWVKVMGILVLLIVALLIVAKVAGGGGGGQHGPGRHTAPAGITVAEASQAVTA